MKKIIHLAFLCIYILAVMLSVLIAFKPGASIFYYKTTIKMGTCVKDEGFAYRCPVSLSPVIYPPGRVLLFENGVQLYPESRHQVSLAGDGCFAAKVIKGGGYNLFFAPIGNTNPLTHAKSYRAYFAFGLFSHTMGILSLGLLLPGLLGFLVFAFGQVKSWKDLRHLPQNTLPLVAGYLAQMGTLIAGIRSFAKTDRRSYMLRWGKLYVATIMAAYGLILIEWIFQVTGATSLAAASLGQKFGAFMLSALFLIGLALILVTALFVLSLALRLVRLAWVAIMIAELAPTALLVMMIVILAENFTYVVFHFGIITSTGLLRVAYGILIGILFVYLYWKRLKFDGSFSKDKQFTGEFRWVSGITIGLVCISLIAALLSFAPNSSKSALASQAGTSALRRPNILLIGSDGLSASHMSIYGYERDTTPNIRALGSTSLVAENAFSNANSTLGSIAALFTSRLPTQTGVIYPPDQLQGADAYQHLPGILSAAGYKTVEIGVKQYVDAYTMNVQNGFDIVNQRSIKNDPLIVAWRDAGYDVSANFIYTLEEKLADRFLQAFYLDSITNPFNAVTRPVGFREDRKRKDQLLALLDQNKGPVFVHVHFMGTHGGEFVIEEPKFSRGEEQYNNWMVDFYDDSILAFDRNFGEIIKYLKTSGQYDNTILIVYADHPMRWNIRERVPLILHFPGDQHAGAITYDTQNIDIAPTLLDYLGLPIPAWMTGRSLLSANPGAGDLIFSALKVGAVQGDTDLATGAVRPRVPPFYGFEAIQAVACNRWYELDLWTGKTTSGLVDGHTAPCAESDLPSSAEVRQRIIDLLESQGFDVSSLR